MGPLSSPLPESSGQPRGPLTALLLLFLRFLLSLSFFLHSLVSPPLLAFSSSSSSSPLARSSLAARFFFLGSSSAGSPLLPPTPLYPSLSPRTCAPTKPTQPPNAAGSKRNYSYLPSALSDSRLFRGSCSLSCRHTILGTRGNQETTSLPGHQQPR